jgi:hypothetical protein
MGELQTTVMPFLLGALLLITGINKYLQWSMNLRLNKTILWGAFARGFS